MISRRVLVVTDIDLAGWALRHALTAAGFVVISAGDVAAARTVIEVSDPFDVLVASLSLGLQEVGKLLDYAAWLWPGVPAIVLAVDPDLPSIPSKADDFIVLEKPYSVEDVVAEVRRVSGRSAPTWGEPPEAGPTSGPTAVDERES